DDRVEPAQGFDHRPGGDAPLTIEACEGRDALYLAAPPCDDLGVGDVLAERRSAVLFGDQERDERRAVPEPHRPDRRSSSTAWIALAPGATRGAGRGRSSRGGAADPILIVPARSSRARRPDGSG